MSTPTETIWNGLLPKKETEALDFVTKNPSWDGRGIVVGILDTGVDPGAVGLSVTTDGKPKIVDVIDCSGSGDVSMGPSIVPNDNGDLIGISGKTLILNKSWTNPTGKYRLGMKRASELYPRGLKERVKEERKKIWITENSVIEAQLQKEIAAASGDSEEDLKARLAQLRQLDKDFEDPGPIYDCLVFHDGQRWQAIVDVSETGDLSEVEPMTDYRVAQQYARFSQIDALNYAVNIFDEGSTLSIVVDAGAHGSHVAGIVAAHHPDQPECNGVAPGAQIISLKIGDSRLGSMETGVGLMRAMIEAVKRGCHIINMSYGEATSWDNVGAFSRLADELVYKHGVIFVSSAGNNGPCISTVGCPGGTTSCCIGVAALATESLMDAAYSLPQPLPQTNYTWSSVGPTLDGELGVSIIAPGGAITSVPNWTLAKKQLMNGTSMSSPNACGCIALVLSAAKATGAKAGPIRVRKAVEASAKFLPQVHVLGQGHGLVQVDKAWALLSAAQADPWGDVRVLLTVNSERFNRGIYLRQPHEASTANTFAVTAEPKFHEDTSPDVKVQFEMRLRLEVTASWVTAPSHLLLLNSTKTFSVQVDPRGLPTGSLNVAFVRGFDESQPAESGPIFELPVTVVRPEVIPDGGVSLSVGELSFTPGERIRRFIVPPPGCTYVDCHIVDTRTPSRAAVTGTDGPVVGVAFDEQAEDAGDEGGAGDDGSRTLVLHAMQTFRGTAYRDHEFERYLPLQPGKEHTVSWAVTSGVTMELVLARAWNTIGTTACRVVLHFRGALPSPTHVLITGGQRVSGLIRVESPLAAVELAPAGKLEKWTAVVKANSQGKVLPLGERDILPDGTPLYQLVLEYDFDQADGGEITPRWPGLQGILYESEFHAQFFMVYDSKKKLLGVGDAWPSAIKTGKGKHVVQLQVRHSSATVLEGLADLPVHLTRPLKSSISLSFFKTQTEALIGTDKQSSRAVAVGSSVSMYVREPTADQLPKQASAGDFLTGSITYLKKNASALGSGTKPGGFPVTYTVADTKPSSSNGGKNGGGGGGGAVGAAESKDESGMATAVREAKVKYLKGLVGGSTEAFEATYAAVSADYPDSLPVRQQLLAHAVQLKSKKLAELKKVADAGSVEARGEIEAVLAAVEAVCALIDEDAIARELGVNVDKEDPTAVTRRKEIDQQKAVLIDALSARACALLDLLTLEEKASASTAAGTEASSAAAVEISPGGGREGTASVTSAATVGVSEGAVVGGIGASADASASALAGSTSTSTKEAFEAACRSLARWDDLALDKHWQLCVGRLRSKGRWGLALKRVNELVASNADNKTKDGIQREALLEERDKCLEKLGWAHFLENSRKWTNLAAKGSYGPF